MATRHPPRFLTTPEAAKRVGLSNRTMEKHRCYGTGPVFRKVGGRVLYVIEELDAWVDLGRRTSTFDLGISTVYPARKRSR